MKVSVPLLTDEELLEVDKNWQYLVDKYMMMTLKEKDQLIAQYVMKKQKEEIERLNKKRETDIKYNKYLQKELAEAHSIIKEVIEYIEKELGNINTNENIIAKGICLKIKRIVGSDKE